MGSVIRLGCRNRNVSSSSVTKIEIFLVIAHNQRQPWDKNRGVFQNCFWHHFCTSLNFDFLTNCAIIECFDFASFRKQTSTSLVNYWSFSKTMYIVWYNTFPVILCECHHKWTAAFLTLVVFFDSMVTQIRLINPYCTKIVEPSVLEHIT